MPKQKKRREASEYGRVISKRVEKPTVLIVCEGANTEPSYFRQFRLASLTVKVEGLGSNTMDLVNRTLTIRDEAEYDQVWVVFDKDGFASADFNTAITKAESKHIGVAYSNQCFEYWLLLHLNDHQGGGMHRRDFDQELNRWLKPQGLIYDGKGSKKVGRDFFEYLMAVDPKTELKRVELAISRAKRVEATHVGKTPADSESSTTVYKLVEYLLKHTS